MEESINLNGDEFNEYLRVLSILKEICNDADIRDGIIRQRSNDNTCIFEINTSSVLNNITMPLTDIKQKIDLLKIFSDQDVTIDVDDHSCTFKDIYSTLTFKKPQLEFMDNKFMTIDDLNTTFTLDDNTLLLSTSISNTISNRIQTIRNGFNVDVVQVKINEETASIRAKTASKDQNAILMSGIVTEIPVNYLTDLSIIPFIIDHDVDIELKMYNVKEGAAVNKFETAIGDMDIVVYSYSRLVESNR